MSLVGPPGFRILPSPPGLGAEVVTRFATFNSSAVADAMGRFNFMDSGIRARSGLPFCGIAVTVNARPADNLMVHKALQIARPGDIVVVCTGGNTTNAVFGDVMCTSAVAAKLGGIVVDGAIRDVDGITRLQFPAYSRAICAGACDKDGPGEINVPIACGGIVVAPGDIVLGDADGVVVVPRADVDVIAALVAQIEERERKRVAEITAGHVFKGEIDDTLRRRGVVE
jgi:4-hydroxy-4-methyl-2-oxoglutarate aldolase